MCVLRPACRAVQQPLERVCVSGVRDVVAVTRVPKEEAVSNDVEVCSYCVIGLSLVAYGSDLWHRGGGMWHGVHGTPHELKRGTYVWRVHVGSKLIWHRE